MYHKLAQYLDGLVAQHSDGLSSALKISLSNTIKTPIFSGYAQSTA